MSQQLVVFDHRTDGVLDVPEKEFGWVLKRFGLRALVLARPGEKVVLSRENPYPEELTLLNAQGFGPRPEDLLFVEPSTRVVQNGLGIEGATMHMFSNVSNYAWALARAYSCRVLGMSQGVAVSLNLKSTFQTMRPLVTAIPEGYAVMDVDEARQAIKTITNKYGEALFKPDFGASGVGTRTFTTVPAAGELLDLHLPGVIQHKVSKLGDFSIQFSFDEQGEPSRLELVGAHMNGSDYSGSYWPICMYQRLPERVIERAMTCFVKVAEVLQDKGVHESYGSLDLMHNYEFVWPAEINFRDTAVRYAIEPIKRKLGRVIPFDMRGFTFPDGTRFRQLVDHFGDLMFDPDTNRGLVLFCYIADTGKGFGYCYGTVYSPDVDDCRKLSEQVEKRKKALFALLP